MHDMKDPLPASAEDIAEAREELGFPKQKRSQANSVSSRACQLLQLLDSA